LTISGKIDLDGLEPDDSMQSLTAISLAGEETEIPFDDSGHYSFEVPGGDWKLKLATGKKPLSRAVSIVDTPIFLSQFKPYDKPTFIKPVV